MWESEKIALLGDGLLPDALGKVLRTLGVQAERIDLETLRGGAVRPKPQEQEGSHDLGATVLVLTCTNSPGPSEILRQIRFLRSVLRWEGALLVIARTSMDRERLEDSSLVGEEIADTRFRAAKGHYSMSQPILLPRLLEQLSALDERRHMFLEEWNALLDLGNLQKLPQKMAKAEAFWKAGKEEQVRSVLVAIVRDLNAIDWLTVAPGHIALNSILGSLSRLPDPRNLEHRDLQLVLTIARGVLKDSQLSGLS